MEIHFGEELEAKLNHAASEQQGGTDEYVRQLVLNYFDHDLWFRKQVQVGLDQLDRGEYITHEAMGERIEQMFRS